MREIQGGSTLSLLSSIKLLKPYPLSLFILGLPHVCSSFLRTSIWVSHTEFSICSFQPALLFFSSPINLHISDDRSKSSIERVETTSCIFMVLLIISINIGSNSYVAHSITKIKQGLVIQTCMFSIFCSDIYNIKQAFWMGLQVISSSLYNSIHGNSGMKISYQSGSRVIRTIITSQLIIIMISYRETLLDQLI
jgi:hypothetical protein